MVTHIRAVDDEILPGSRVAVSIQLKNTGTKTIMATKGALIVYDAFGSQTMRLSVSNAKTIRPGRFVTESGEWNIMFDAKAQNAISGSSADISKLSFAFEASEILFEDGSRLQF